MDFLKKPAYSIAGRVLLDHDDGFPPSANLDRERSRDHRLPALERSVAVIDFVEHPDDL